ncbi:hypothetical protein FQN54_006476 [Arachnomyces sp. PD_36]|nr:hypothetical protein FQN54_006476 [Arachnomyces sp. PD_36]
MATAKFNLTTLLNTYKSCTAAGTLCSRSRRFDGDGSEGAYGFTLTDRLLRYGWSEDGDFEDRAPMFAPWRYFDVPDSNVVDEDDHLEVVTSAFHLRYDKKSFTSEGLSVQVGDGTWYYDGKSYGDLGGTVRTLDGVDDRIKLNFEILA